MPPGGILGDVADRASNLASIARLLGQDGEVSPAVMELFILLIRDAAGALQGDADALDNRNRRRRARMGARGVRTGRADDVTLPDVQAIPASSVVAGVPSRQVRPRRRHGRRSA